MYMEQKHADRMYTEQKHADQKKGGYNEIIYG